MKDHSKATAGLGQLTGAHGLIDVQAWAGAKTLMPRKREGEAVLLSIAQGMQLAKPLISLTLRFSLSRMVPVSVAFPVSLMLEYPVQLGGLNGVLNTCRWATNEPPSLPPACV